MLHAAGAFIESFQKLTPVPLLAAGIATGALLFLPDDFATTLGVDTFREAYRGYIGAICIGSCAFLAAQFLGWCAKQCLFRVRAGQTRRKQIQSLQGLTPGQRARLRVYMERDVRTHKFSKNDCEMPGLANDGIVHQAGDVTTLPAFRCWTLAPWVRVCLLKHPELLQEAETASPPQ